MLTPTFTPKPRDISLTRTSFDLPVIPASAPKHARTSRIRLFIGWHYDAICACTAIAALSGIATALALVIG